MTNERKNQLCDLALERNKMFQEDTKEMTNEERMFYLETMVMALSGALSIFRKAVVEGHADQK